MTHSATHDGRLPMISVVVPVHNGARWIGETLASLYAQSESDFEIVLVDDASSDELLQVLAEHPDPRLRITHLARNVGVSAARNHGIDLARGRYIAFCDADDLCLPDRFVRQLAFLKQHPDIGLCGSAFTTFDTADRETVFNSASSEEIRRTLMHRNSFGLSTVMARADVLKAHRFDQSLNVAEDYELWTRLAGLGVQLANLPDSLVRYRLHLQQASRHKSAWLDQVARRVRSLYCAALLGDAALQARLRAGNLGLDDLELAACAIARHVSGTARLEARDFRFMLAWVYQQLPQHGVRAWWRWTRIQRQLGLALDSNYRLNIAVLAWLPSALGRKYFETLIKLKR